MIRGDFFDSKRKRDYKSFEEKSWNVSARDC